jgi:hypothetical protein
MHERLARIRWRWRGAWLWPVFVLAIVLDAIIGHLLPPVGEAQRVGSAALVGCFLSLLAIVGLSLPFGALVRRRRPDMPRLIARDYGGVAAVAAVSAGLLIAGLAHRSTITAHRQARRDAIIRAQAYIGDRAPEPFRRNLAFVDVYAIEPGSMYRICVPDPHRPRAYCVIVNSRLPLDRSVSFAGYESNAVFAQGAE